MYRCLLLLIMAAGSQTGGMPKYSNPDSKSRGSYIDFDRKRLAEFFGNFEETNLLPVAIGFGLPEMKNEVFAVSGPTIYAATSDGIYKSTNGGDTWAAANSGLNHAAVEALAIDPSTPQIVYAGTSGGIFKSANGGTKWSNIFTSLSPRPVSSLAIDPSAPQTIYAGMSGAIAKSTNGGDTWSANSLDLSNIDVRAIAIDSSTTRIIYAATSVGILKSTDSGATWIPKAGNLSQVASLAIGPSNSQIVYAGSIRDGVYKSTNGGDTWVYSALGNNTIQGLAIDSSMPQTIYAITNTGAIYKSANSGVDWDEYIRTYGSTTPCHLAIDPSTPHTIYFSRNRLIIKNTDKASTENTKLAGADKLSVKVNPPLLPTKHAGLKRTFVSANRVESGGQNIQKRINRDKQWFDQDRALLLPGDNPLAAGAGLLKLLEDFADQSRVNIISKSNLPDKKIQGLTKVSVHMEATCDIEQLVRFLAAIRNYPKYLKVEELLIIIHRVIGAQTKIRSRLAITGYFSSMEDEGAAGNSTLIQAEALEEKLGFIEDVLCKKDMNLEILRELTRVLPMNDTYLIGYINRDGVIQLDGNRSPSANLIQILDKTPFFQDLSEKTIIRMGADPVLFTIEAKLKK
jgi:photosystem II stability/assembly factor-like uncharacterized protein